MGEAEKVMFHDGHIRVAHVIDENEDMITVEIPKSDKHTFNLEDSDKKEFYTMLFVRKIEDNLAVWLPWEGE